MHETPPITRHSLPIASSMLSVIEAGQGPAVLLGHGYLWDWRMWEPQVAALSRHYRVIIPELWGHGASGPLPQGAAALPKIAEQMIEVLDALDVDRCVVAGSSVGGMWGAHLAATAPQRVAGLAILNSYLGAEPVERNQAYGSMLDAVHTAGRIPEVIADAIVPLFFALDIARTSPELPARLRAEIQSYSSESIRTSIVPLGRAIFGRPDRRDLLEAIRAPMLLVGGLRDQARPIGETRDMAAQLDLTPVEIDSGHTASLEQPLAVTSTLETFLEKIGWSESRRRG
jgi:pimeloyl-ACP methyl ester carboxylesterase